MGLVFYWYDFVCFGIVLGSIVASLWFLCRKERGCSIDVVDTAQNSLLPYSSRPKSFGTARLWTSCWRKLHPGWLLFSRSIAFLSMAALLAWDLVVWDASIFVYYTEWTFMLVMIYFAMGILASLYGFFVYSIEPTPKNMEEAILDNVEDETGQKLVVYGCIMQTIYQTSAGSVLLTDIVFWIVNVPFLSNTRLGLSSMTICMHTANILFLLIETILNNLSFPWFRLGYFVLWSCLYVLFQWIIHACGLTWWPYPFLRLDNVYAPLWYLTMTLAHIPCYGAYYAITKAKDSCFSYLFPNAFLKP